MSTLTTTLGFKQTAPDSIAQMAYFQTQKLGWIRRATSIEGCDPDKPRYLQGPSLKNAVSSHGEVQSIRSYVIQLEIGSKGTPLIHACTDVS